MLFYDPANAPPASYDLMMKPVCMSSFSFQTQSESINLEVTRDLKFYGLLSFFVSHIKNNHMVSVDIPRRFGCVFIIIQYPRFQVFLFIS